MPAQPETIPPVLMSAVQAQAPLPLPQAAPLSGAGTLEFLRRHAPELAGAAGGLLLGALFLLFRRKGRGRAEGDRAEFAAHLKAELDKQSGLSRG